MEETHTLRLRINLLGITGALIGISTLFLPWYTTIGQVPGSQPIDHGLIDSMSSYILRYDQLAFSSCALFLIGMAMAFISPVGGIVQTAAILLFSFNQSTTGMEGVTPIWIAPLIGLLSGIISMTALIKPTGIGFKIETNDALPRLLNISLYRR